MPAVDTVVAEARTALAPLGRGRRGRTGQPEPEVVGSDGYVPESCLLHPERVVEYPYFDLLPQVLRARISAWEGGEDEIEEDSVTYRTDLSIAPGWKAGGHASWHATDPASVVCDCGRAMELLLTVASSEWDNGCRTWIPLEDLPTADAMGAGRPAQVTVGRGGDMNVFVCPADPAHPHRLVLQG